jgi:hypothetical protein
MTPFARQLDRLDRLQGSSVMDAAFPRRCGGRPLLVARAASHPTSHDTPGHPIQEEAPALREQPGA